MREKLQMMGKLFLTLFKIGLFTVGGGYAMIALLEDELIEKKKWLDRETFLDVVAVAESTPGPIAINTATFVGYKQAGVAGALAATVGVCLPSLIIIYVISLFFEAFLSLTLVTYAFAGIRACVVYLILSAGVKMAKGLKKSPMDIVLLCATILLMVTLTLLAIKLSTVLYILAGGLVGLSLFLVKKWQGGGAK